MCLSELKKRCDSVLVLDTETSGLSFNGSAFSIF